MTTVAPYDDGEAAPHLEREGAAPGAQGFSRAERGAAVDKPFISTRSDLIRVL
jgi:hypothetical protein